jgi:ParB family chromosome partitioning protein
MSKSTETPLARLKPNPLNPRQVDANDPKVIELADSIRARGVLQPLLITPDHVIVAGHRRAVAARLAGLVRVPTITKALSEADQLAAILVENLQREGLNPVQTGLACERLVARGRSVEEIARSTGLSSFTVRRYLALAKLPLPLLQAISKAPTPIPLGYIDVLAKLAPDMQVTMGIRAIRQNWLVHELEKNSRLALRGKPDRDAPDPRLEPQVTMSLDRGVALLTELVAGLRRAPHLVTQARFVEELHRLQTAVREAQA